MPTIKQLILKQKADRLQKLIGIRAPEVIIQSLQAQVDSKTVIAKNIDKYGDIEASSVVYKKGRGGKVYAIFSTKIGDIYYFPNARFKPFLTQMKDKEKE